MKNSILMLGALLFVLGACGGSDDSGKESKNGSGLACISKDEEGRPGVCTLYAGMYGEVMGMDFFCPASQVEYLERAKRCPTGEGFVGHCQHYAGEDQETSVYYYLYDDVDGEGAAFMQDACERGEGTWKPSI